MKLIITLVLSVGALSAVAAWQPPSENPVNMTEAGRIKGYRIGACDYWVNSNTTSGSVYGCGFYPQRITVADGYDVANALDEAMKRIEALEARVAELEKKP